MENETRVLAPPPLLFAGALAAGAALEWIAPFRPAASWAWRVAFGLPWIVVGAVLLLAALRSLRAAGTTMSPFGGSTAVVTKGPYAFTRNPIYLGMVAVYVGIAFVFGLVWGLLLLPAVFLLVDAAIVRREEAYLAERFGGAYLDYRRRVRRWL